MVWQDIAMTIANSAFAVCLIPQVYNGFREKRGFITLATSGPTFIGLFAISMSLYSLNLIFSAVTAALAGTLWLILFIQRIIYKKA